MKPGRPMVHGQSGTKAYKAWEHLTRAVRRGDAEMDPRWVSFAALYADMGAGTDYHHLRRIDTSQPWSKDNCRWMHKSRRRVCIEKK